MEEDPFADYFSEAATPTLPQSQEINHHEATQADAIKEPFMPFPPGCEGFTTKNASDLYNDPWQEDREQLVALCKLHRPDLLNKPGSSPEDPVPQGESNQTSKKFPTAEWDPEFSFDDYFEYYQNLTPPRSPSDPIIPPVARPPHRAFLSVLPHDARSKPPISEADRDGLHRALFHTRQAFLHWTGHAAPQTDVTKSYAYQYHQLGEEFHILWLTMNPDRDTPCLFCLPMWEGNISGWKEPEEDKRYMAPYVYACTKHFPDWPKIE